MQTTLPIPEVEGSPQRPKRRTLLKAVKDLGSTLTPEERKKLHKRFAYLYRLHQDDDHWKAIGTLRGLISQFELLEAILQSKGLRLPPRRRLRRKVAPGQLALFPRKDLEHA